MPVSVSAIYIIIALSKVLAIQGRVQAVLRGLTLEFRGKVAQDSLGLPSYITTLMSAGLK